MYQRKAIAQTGEFTTRDADGGEMRIEGYFSVFNRTYELWPGARETIEPGAFDGTLDGDIRALCNHDTAAVLGRTTAGTLELRQDEKGLWGSILINPKDQDAVNLYERVKRGDVTQCSFGFDIIDEDYEVVNEETVWHVRKVKLYEVSVVTFPAYEDTAVEARRRDLETIQKRRTEDFKHRALERLSKIKGL